VIEDELATILSAGANPAGGWGYSTGTASRIEPTCWAMLALANGPVPDSDSHLGFLSRCRRPDGLLSDRPEFPANLSWTALGFLTLSTLSTSRATIDSCARLLDAIANTAGVQLADDPTLRQSNMLKGWPWMPETFSWVEPTSWCLLALKRAVRMAPARATDALRSRIADGEALLVDRVCESGGWNFGNSNAFGKSLPAHVPTSALGLLALQDKRDLAVIRRSLVFVEAHWRRELSGTALALSLLCLRIYGRPTAEIETAIGDQWQHTRFLGNLATTSMVRCALTMNPATTAALSLS
jgi:hypothetical protein